MVIKLSKNYYLFYKNVTCLFLPVVNNNDEKRNLYWLFSFIAFSILFFSIKQSIKNISIIKKSYDIKKIPI